MTSLDIHLRHLLRCAQDKRSHGLVDDAFAIVNGHFDRFSIDCSPELLVLFAEVASDLREREPHVARALELFERLRCEDDQFKIRAMLVRCVYEARLGSEFFQLKGQHLLQQLKHALGFLVAALSIATRPGNDTRYGFLVCNASFVFWEVVRPVCRPGWQSHVAREAEAVVAALRAVAQSGGSGLPGEKGKQAASAGAAIPAAVDAAWLIELSLSLAFGYEDSGDLGSAQKAVDAASALLEDLLKQPVVEPGDARLRVRDLVWNARAHFARKQPDKTRQDIGGMAGTALFVCNGGIQKCEDELITAWAAIDNEVDLREAMRSFDPGCPAGSAGNRGPSKTFSPQKLIDLALATRAACTSGCHALAAVMLGRLEKLHVPAGRGRVMADLSRAEVDVWRACRPEHEDPASGMLLGPDERERLESEARQHAVGLCEQCIMAARRIEDVGLVEESAVVLWNLGRELLSSRHRVRIHKSLQKCADVLEAVQSTRLLQLRVQLHLEVASCEVAQDLLTKGCRELRRATALDCTQSLRDLPEALQRELEERQLDPAPHLRRLDAPASAQLRLLELRLSLYEEPD
eukprot:CAMPEP_0168483988 /NCGR_PEP_ID=MMETSP0228-20121227/65860_1 /TAXON_ID=133427 /ORGANISM="Protoceratium reticulatum, Strain CCCM 535 (=CCMP 1889)" /LENGTH=576 /DNA_ID=CAMNT_0008500503 /DNA_START=10 /DNA_END=1737 /DNA_ORIENTATION=+